MKAIILDYEWASVKIIDIPTHVDDVETYLTEDLELDLNNCEWMSANELDIQYIK